MYEDENEEEETRERDVRDSYYVRMKEAAATRAARAALHQSVRNHCNNSSCIWTSQFKDILLMINFI